MNPELIVVGSGFYGSTVARKFAETFNKKVLILEQRSHIGGNAYSHIYEGTNIEVHNYGTHIFHTNNLKVIEFITRFSEFNSYRHTVWSKHNGATYSLPVNLATINKIYGENFSSEEAENFIMNEAKEIPEELRDLNLENKAISSVGRKIYEALIKNYTEKQWQTPPNLLPAETISRLPVRFNLDNSYFSDDFQGLPTQGYSVLFENLLSHPCIEVQLDTDYFETNWAKQNTIPIVYTGPIDRFFNYKHGKLNWRTVDFRFEVLPDSDFQGTAVINYPDLDVPYTRIHEFKHLYPERAEALDTVIMKEFSRFAAPEDEPYYPINSPADREVLMKYRSEIETIKNVWFGGRLGTYQYLDMHMAIASALSFFENTLAST
jgi:UDP-galactopyranose mutase